MHVARRRLLEVAEQRFGAVERAHLADAGQPSSVSTLTKVRLRQGVPSTSGVTLVMNLADKGR